MFMDLNKELYVKKGWLIHGKIEINNGKHYPMQGLRDRMEKELNRGWPF